LWSFGQNDKRALSVQKKDAIIHEPRVSLIKLKSDLQTLCPDDYVVEVATADEHSACVTQNGRIYTVGSNQHQKLGLEGKTILDTQTQFTMVTQLLEHHIV
jgi:alpha-tubulin suppressor-like RCC1 family protein